MPFDWKNYFDLAKVLAAQPGEAEKRSAVSRAYYSVFNIAIENLRAARNDQEQKANVHAWCWEAYGKSRDAEARYIGILGGRMKGKRVKADYYGADSRRFNDEVTGTLQDAEEFFEKIPNVRHEYLV
jgi:uncharacterized protein (UPF0332 family)